MVNSARQIKDVWAKHSLFSSLCTSATHSQLEYDTLNRFRAEQINTFPTYSIIPKQIYEPQVALCCRHLCLLNYFPQFFPVLPCLVSPFTLSLFYRQPDHFQKRTESTQLSKRVGNKSVFNLVCITSRSTHCNCYLSFNEAFAGYTVLRLFVFQCGERFNSHQYYSLCMHLIN